jgi:glutathione synthase/RimK-type ligase-like ATP-grasp enzyme
LILGGDFLEVKIRKLYDENNTCLIDKKIYDLLKLSNEKIYNLHLGHHFIPCSILPSENPSSNIYLPKDFFNELLLYDNLPLNIWRKGINIHLGPVVAILFNNELMRAISRGRIPSDAFEHIELAAPAANCLCYCFSYKDKIDWENKKMQGYTYNVATSQWQHGWFPMPNVVYDRGVFFDKDLKPVISDIRMKLRSIPGIYFINNLNSLGKWQVYRRLLKYAEVKQYLPETILYESFNDIIAMLEKYDFIFVKSSFGSRGEEILSIKKTDSKYRVDFFEEELKISLINSIEELKNFINKFIEEKKQLGREMFIVQHGIKLIKFKDHYMDLRVHVVKNENGRWQVTNLEGDYAKDNSTITNSCVGGIYDRYERMYPELKNNYKNIIIPTREEINSTTIKIAEYIEKEFGAFGEMGIDMAIDSNGKMWFFEGNAKPDKYRTEGVDDMTGIAPQALGIFKYSIYLTKKYTI